MCGCACAGGRGVVGGVESRRVSVWANCCVWKKRGLLRARGFHFFLCAPFRACRTCQPEPKQSRHKPLASRPRCTHTLTHIDTHRHIAHSQPKRKGFVALLYLAASPVPVPWRHKSRCVRAYAARARLAGGFSCTAVRVRVRVSVRVRARVRVRVRARAKARARARAGLL